MKLNISDPTTGASKVIDIEDEKKYHIFFDKRLSQEVDASSLGEEFQGYVLKITGGSDKQGFGMKQGVLVNHRVRLLLDGRTSGFHPTRKDGERRRKTVRGCIVAQDIAVLDCVVVKKGSSALAGITDRTIPNRLGPKRASKIRRLFNLTKEDNVCQYVIRRTIPAKKEGGKAHTKAPKVQRLVTPATLQRKRHLAALLRRRYAKAKADRKTYREMLTRLAQEKNTARALEKKTAAERVVKKKALREEYKMAAEKKRLAAEEAQKKREAAAKKVAPPKKAPAKAAPPKKAPAKAEPAKKAAPAKKAEPKKAEKKPAQAPKKK